MWCWPQPFGQPLILMSSPGTAATRSGRSLQAIPEQPAEAARLGHGELARLGARAARDVRDRPGAAARQAGGVQASIERFTSRLRTQRKTRF